MNLFTMGKRAVFSARYQLLSTERKKEKDRLKEKDRQAGRKEKTDQKKVSNTQTDRQTDRQTFPRKERHRKTD